MLRLKEADAQLYYEMLEFGRRNIGVVNYCTNRNNQLDVANLFRN